MSRFSKDLPQLNYRHLGADSEFTPRRAVILGLGASMLIARVAHAEPNALERSLQSAVTPEMFGALGNGHDDTNAVRAALAMNAPVYLRTRYRIAGTISVGRQLLFGSSSRVSGFVIGPDFDAAASAVIHLTGGEPGGELRDLSISFLQPDTADRSSLIRYPPAIVANLPRFKLGRLRIERATVAIDMRGNAGGATLDDIEISAFNCAIWIDGSLDSVKITKFHVWPFGVSPRQRKVYSDHQNRGLLVGRCDDLHLSDGIVHAIPNAATFVRSPKGTAFGHISGVDFDHWGGLTVESGRLRVIGCSFTAGERAAKWVRLFDGALMLSSCWFHSVVSLDSAGIEVRGGNASFLGQTLHISTTDADFVHVDCEMGVFNASGINVYKGQARHYRSPLFRFGNDSKVSLGQVTVSPGLGNASVIQAMPQAYGSVYEINAPGWRADLGGLRGTNLMLETVRK